MFVMGCYGHRLSNSVLFAYHLVLDIPGGSSHLGYRRRVPLWHNPGNRVKGAPGGPRGGLGDLRGISCPLSPPLNLI